MTQNADVLAPEWRVVLAELNNQSYPPVDEVFPLTIDGKVRWFRLVRGVQFHINSYGLVDEIATYGTIPDERVLRFLKAEYQTCARDFPVGICQLSFDNPNGRRSHQCLWNGCLLHLGHYNYFDFDGSEIAWLVEVDVEMGCSMW